MWKMSFLPQNMPYVLLLVYQKKAKPIEGKEAQNFQLSENRA